MKILKIIIFLFAIANITNIKAQKTFESFIDVMKNSEKHTSSIDFENYIYPNYDIYNGHSIKSFSLGLDGTPIKFYSRGKVANRYFYENEDIILKKYDINPNIKTILIRTNLGYPERLSLLNLKKENGKYIPVADLSACTMGGGEHQRFYFNNIKNWVIYNYSNDIDYALGVAYKIDNAGNFIEVHRQEFNELNFEDIFKYKGYYIYPPLEAYIYQKVSRTAIKKIDNDKVSVYNLHDVFKKLDDNDIKRLISYYFDRSNKLKTLSIPQIRRAIGARNSSESIHYNIIAPFDAWLKGKIKEYLLRTYNVVEFDSSKGVYAHPLSVCKNNDCVIKPDFLFGGTIKFKMVNGVAIVEDLDNIVGRLSDSSLSKFVGRYFPSIRVNGFESYILKDHEDNGYLTESHRIDQNKFKDIILSYIVPKYASEARFKFCEGAYYHCTCVKPCKK